MKNFMHLKNNTGFYTKDFNKMIQIVIWNSLGFFFLEFLIIYVASQRLDISGVQLGLIFSVIVIGNLTSMFFAGILTDRIKSRTKLILFGSFGRGVSYFILYFALILNSLLGLGIGAFTLGFFAGFFWIPFDTLIAEKSSKDHRSYAFGKKSSATGKGTLIGAIIGFILFIWMLNITDNPFLIYISLPIFAFANFYAGIQFNRKVDESIKFLDDTIKANNTQIKKNRRFEIPKILFVGIFFLLVVLFLSNVNGSLAKPFLNLYLLEVIENNALLVTLAWLPSGIISMLLAPKLGKYVDKIHPSVGITITSITGSIVTLLLINTTNIWVFAILLIFDVTIVNTASLVFDNLLSRITLENRGKIMGIRSVFVSIGNIIGPILGGIAWDYLGPTAPFLISIIVEISLIPLYWVAVFYIKPNIAETYEISVPIPTEKI
jgi:MFS family permease